MIIKIILLAFIAFAIFRLARRYYERAITLRWLVLWLMFWGASAVIVAVPEIMSKIATMVGIGRGADLAVYLAVLALYYLLFRAMVKLERVEKDISKLTEELAIRENQKSNIKSQN